MIISWSIPFTIVSKPRVSIIKKNRIDQNGAPGMVVTAKG
jgi:hypothetical protein